MPRTIGRAACPASTSAASARSSQACATTALGSPCSAAIASTQRVSASGVVGIPLGLDIDGLDDVEAGAVAAVVRRHVAAPEARIVAVAERDRLRIAEPGVVVARQVPEMLVRVDDRQLVARFHGRSAGAGGGRRRALAIDQEGARDGDDERCRHAGEGEARLAMVEQHADHQRRQDRAEIEVPNRRSRRPFRWRPAGSRRAPACRATASSPR